jgi:carbonic anhydrase/acetyltransferase-like protein (isoleucine patch superfamily)
MAIIKSVRGFTPKMGRNCYLADNATLIGDVIMGDDCSIWFGAVLRGDVNPIRIGNRVNIQDNCTVHTTFEDSVAEIGDDVTIGHNVVIHGARVEARALIGIGSVLLDHAVLEPNSLYAGVPVKRIKTVDPLRRESMIKRIAEDYIKYADWYREG